MPLDSLLARHWLLTLSSLASRRRLPVDCPSIGLPLRRAFTLSSLPTAYARNATASASEAFERGLDFLVSATDHQHGSPLSPLITSDQR